MIKIIKSHINLEKRGTAKLINGIYYHLQQNNNDELINRYKTDANHMCSVQLDLEV